MNEASTPSIIHPIVDYEISQIAGLSEEQRDVYTSYVSHLAKETGAKTLLTQRVIVEVVGAMTEGARFQSQGLAAIENLQLTAAENIFRKLDHGGEPLTSEVTADIAEKAREYRTNLRFQDATRDRLKKAGYPPDAVEIEAQRLSLDISLATARLGGFAGRRLHRALKSLADAFNLERKRKGAGK